MIVKSSPQDFIVATIIFWERVEKEIWEFTPMRHIKMRGDARRASFIVLFALVYRGKLSVDDVVDLFAHADLEIYRGPKASKNYLEMLEGVGMAESRHERGPATKVWYPTMASEKLLDKVETIIDRKFYSSNITDITKRYDPGGDWEELGFHKKKRKL